jgi:acyl-CoA synthetase (AMP-forming)/AMP-acid ligase II
MVGRKKEVIKSGGETVVPNEIEGCGVKWKASKRHAWWEWRIAIGESAFMQSSPMVCRSRQAARCCRGALPRTFVELQVPKTWTVVDVLPTRPVGKIDKAAVRQVVARERNMK